MSTLDICRGRGFRREVEEASDPTRRMSAGAGRRLAFARRNDDTSLMKSTVVTSSPDVMGGTPVFAGTRVPIENLLDYLEGGESIEDFLEGFPSVSREQIIVFLEETKARVLAEAG